MTRTGNDLVYKKTPVMRLRGRNECVLFEDYFSKEIEESELKNGKKMKFY
jgi:hypothetical protein